MSVKEIMDTYHKLDQYYIKLQAFEKEAKENAEL
jgi:hypothetical protein